MGREQRRLLIDPGRLQQAPAGLVGLTPAESRYLVKVLRYGPGAIFAISDGAGCHGPACISGLGAAYFTHQTLPPSMV